MFNIKVNDFKIFDSLLNIENINYVVAEDENYNNVIVDKYNLNEKNDIDLELIKRENDPIFCKVNVIGTNGKSGFVEAKEDFSRNEYLFKGFDVYQGKEILHDRIILGELIYDKNNNLIHHFQFLPEDKIIYIKELNKSLDIDFNFKILSNKKFTFPRLFNSGSFVYNSQTITTKDEKLVIATKVRFDQLMTNYIRYNLNKDMTNKYIEVRIKLPVATNINTYIKLINFNNNNNVELLNRVDEIIESSVNGIDTVLNNYIVNEYNIIGMFFKDNNKIELYLNHKLIFTFTNLSNFDFDYIDIGNDVVSNEMVESNVLVDYVRIYDKRSDYTNIGY